MLNSFKFNTLPSFTHLLQIHKSLQGFFYYFIHNLIVKCIPIMHKRKDKTKMGGSYIFIVEQFCYAHKQGYLANCTTTQKTSLKTKFIFFCRYVIHFLGSRNSKVTNSLSNILQPFSTKLLRSR